MLTCGILEATEFGIGVLVHPLGESRHGLGVADAGDESPPMLSFNAAAAFSESVPAALVVIPGEFRFV